MFLSRFPAMWNPGLSPTKLHKKKHKKDLHTADYNAYNDSEIFIEEKSEGSVTDSDSSVISLTYNGIKKPKKRKVCSDSNIAGENDFDNSNLNAIHKSKERKKGHDLQESECYTDEISKIKDKECFRELSSSMLPLDSDVDPVDFEVPRLHERETVHSLTKEETEIFQNEGIFIKRGTFSKEEDKIIEKNFEMFSKKYRVSDPFLLLGIGRYKRDSDVLRFIKAKHFYLRLGKGLNNRTLDSIYRRARVILHPYKSDGRFNEEEVSRLKKIHNVVNNKWHYIGEVLGRSGGNCYEAYRWHQKPISKGVWTKTEQEQLIEGVKKVSGSSDLSNDKIKNISWQEVALHVPTRNSSQCRIYWSDHFGWNSDSKKEKWNKSCYVKLINILSKEWDVNDASEIDWTKVYESFVNVAPSYIYIQRRWYYLRSQIPGYKNMKYKRIIELLRIKYEIDE